MASEFDYVIVGGGSAGGFLLRRLSADPSVRVLLLEAGGSDRHWTVQIPGAVRSNYRGGPRNWSFHTEPEPHMFGRRLFQPRGRVLGGSSSINGMVFVRGNARDYDRWAAEGATGWSAADVLPSFRRIERYAGGTDQWRGGDGPVAVRRSDDTHPIEQAFLLAGEQAGHARTADCNGAEQEGFFVYDVNVDAGFRAGTARACIRPAMRRSNVTVVTGAHVTRLAVEHGRAVGVEYLRDGQRHVARAAREVILSAGAFGSPQLLLLSGIGPADELRSVGVEPLLDLPGVGRNLHDHLEVHIQHTCPAGLSKNGLLRRDRVLRAGVEWCLFRRGPAALPHSRVGAFVRSDAAVPHPDIQYHFWAFYLEGWSPPPARDGYCFGVGPLRTQSRGSVRLASADPLASPRILLNGLQREQDLVEFRACVRLSRELARQSAFDFCRGPEVEPGPGVVSDADIDAYVRASANSAYHPCGSCRMGSDEDAVVDPQARVRGIEGLRVADASIMPSITSGNINAPSMMIGERVAGQMLGAVPGSR